MEEIISIDIIEADSATMSTWRMIGLLPNSAGTDDNGHSLYVNVVDGVTIVSYSITDEIVVKGRGFGKTMTALANRFGVAVHVERDEDVKHGSKVEGVYDPTELFSEPETAETARIPIMSDEAEYARISELDSMPIVEGFAWQRHVQPGERATESSTYQLVALDSSCRVFGTVSLARSGLWYAQGTVEGMSAIITANSWGGVGLMEAAQVLAAHVSGTGRIGYDRNGAMVVIAKYEAVAATGLNMVRRSALRRRKPSCVRRGWK